MANVRELKLALLDWEVRYILKGIASEMDRLKKIAEESSDEDEAADAGNDYLEVAGLKERMEAEAVSVFGSAILTGC